MLLKMKKITYFARLVPGGAPGIELKIKSSVRALNELGYNSNYEIHPYHGMANIKNYILSIAKSNSDLLVIRNSNIAAIIYPVLILKRIFGKIIIIDVPTPLGIEVREIFFKEIGFLRKTLRILLLYLSFPWSLTVANLILQYSQESKYFSLLIKSRMMLSANGFDVSSVSFEPKSLDSEIKSITIVGVAALAKWHGFDRLILSIARYIKDNSIGNKWKVRFIIVGEGAEAGEYLKLVKNNGLDNIVKLVGVKLKKELHYIYRKADVAVSSLGLYRTGLEIASTLKAREYAAHGIPFIAAGYDPDFVPLPPFVLKVKNSDEPIDFIDIIEWYEKIMDIKNYSSHIRQYALDKLDYKSKWKCLIDRVNR